MPIRQDSSQVSTYTKTYTSFSGCDIAAAFNGRVIGELQAISYSIQRETAPIYTMGSAEPRSFSRGKRGIAGRLVVSQFDRDALIEEFNKMIEEDVEKLGIQKFKTNDRSFIEEQGYGNNTAFLSLEDWDRELSDIASGGGPAGEPRGNISDLTSKYKPVYADEILPFDITITMANEYGQSAVLVIYGVEILNEGSGFSIDTVAAEKAYTFVARRVAPMRRLSENDGFASSYF